MLKKIMMLLILSLVSGQVFAAGGDRVGNGGDVIICGKKVELLDIYEARLSGYKLKTPEGANYNKMLENIITKKMAPIQPIRANRYLSNLRTLNSEMQFLPGITLNDVDDAGVVAIPKGCTLEQVAIQLSDDVRPAGKKRYTVSLDLWNQMDDLNKVALILHEVIYREAIQSETVTTSMMVRAMVGEILRDELNLPTYLQLGASISNVVEYKNLSWLVCKKCGFDIFSDTNEYGEKILEMRSAREGINVFYKGRSLFSEKVQIRISDGKILSADNHIVLLRANVQKKFNYEDGMVVSLLSDKEVEFVDGFFYGLDNHTIKFSYLTQQPFEINLKNVNKLYWSKVRFSDSETITGDFSVQYKNMMYEYSENIFMLIKKNGSVSFLNN